MKSVAVCCSWILFKKILLNRNTTHTDRGAGDAVPVVPGGARAGASAARGVDGAERARGCGVRKGALIFYPLSLRAFGFQRLSLENRIIQNCTNFWDVFRSFSMFEVQNDNIENFIWEFGILYFLSQKNLGYIFLYLKKRSGSISDQKGP